MFEKESFMLNLKKSPFDRTPADRKKLYAGLRELKSFNKLSDFVLGQLCGVVSYTYFEENRVVFKQGLY
jgi:hypothetical protein